MIEYTHMIRNIHWSVVVFTLVYLTGGALYFMRDLNLEFVIYVAVIGVIFGAVAWAQPFVRFTTPMLAALSLWGLMHVLGGLVTTPDGVLFAYRIYPFLDLGGDFYILKYDQVVHAYLYGLVAVMTYHMLHSYLAVSGRTFTVILVAILVSVGISGLNEIMEFLIAVTVERNGVGGYENAMLDLIFNLAGAVVGTLTYVWSVCRYG